MAPTEQKASRRWNVRPFHRILGILVLIGALYLAVTGSVIQAVDLRALLSHAPGTDKEMAQIHEGINGPGNFAVIQPGDYDASPLPENFDYGTALSTVLSGARAKAGESAEFKFVELRVLDGKPIGAFRLGERTLRVDAASGAALPDVPRPGPQPQSIHLKFKILHTLRGKGDFINVLHFFVAIGLFALTVAGVILYFQLLGARSRAGLKGWFWSSGGAWRSTHRAVSIVAAIFLLVISASGTMLSIDQIGLGVYRWTHKDGGKYALFPKGAIADFSSPLPDAKLPAMLSTTLSAWQQTKAVNPGVAALKVVRLRYFAGIPQGVVLAGKGEDTKQLVYQAETGRPMGITEPEYPKTHYHLGWNEHEVMKKIHRGDAFGIPGRVMDLFAGLSLIYLSISGAVLYFSIWWKRRRAGRGSFFWA